MMLLSRPPQQELIILLSIMVLLIPTLLIFKRKSRWKLMLALFITVPLFITYIPNKPVPSQPHTTDSFTLPQQQVAFQEWFKKYQITLDNLEKIRQDFTRTLFELETGEISKSSASEDFASILTKAKTHHEELEKLLPPPELPLIQQELINNLIRETQTASTAYIQLLEDSVKTLDEPKNKHKKTVDLAYEIKKSAILASPVYLDIMPTIAKLKNDLKL